MTTPELKPIQADLLPCPWCSSKDLRLEVDDIDGWIGFYKCGNCDAVGPMTEYKYEDQAEAGREAITAWNTRLNHSNTPSQDTVAIPRKVYDFLLGEDHLDGYLFGDHRDDERGAFWWRKHLRPTPPADHNGGGR